MTRVNENLDTILKYCSINNIVKIKKSSNSIFFNEISDYKNIDLSDMPVDMIEIRLNGVDEKFNYYRDMKESDQQYKITYIDKRGNRKNINVSAYGNVTPLEKSFAQTFHLDELFKLDDSNSLYNKVANYVLNNLYDQVKKIGKEVKEEKRIKDEKEEQERFDRLHSEEVKEYNLFVSKANAILDVLGTTKEESHDEYYYDYKTEYKEYKGYGLKIVNNGKGSSFAEGVWISYNNETVLSPLSRIDVKPGRWREIFDEIYNNLSCMKDQKRESDLYIKPVVDSIKKIDDLIPLDSHKNEYTAKAKKLQEIINKYLKEYGLNLFIGQASELDYESNTYSISKNGETLFYAVYHSIWEDKVVSRFSYVKVSDNKYYALENLKFKPGTWVYDFEKCTKDGLNYNKELDNSIYDSGVEKNLRLLRENLKRY